MSKMLTFTLAFCMLTACQRPEQKHSATQARDPNLPQMKKIEIERPEQADSLIQAGVDVIVVEGTYVIARVAQTDIAALEDSQLNSVDAEESDFVQRLIKISGHNREHLTEFAEMGLDIWEVQADTVLAQAFDKHISQLRQNGLSVKIIARDIRNYAKKLAAEQ